MRRVVLRWADGHREAFNVHELYVCRTSRTLIMVCERVSDDNYIGKELYPARHVRTVVLGDGGVIDYRSWEIK